MNIKFFRFKSDLQSQISNQFHFALLYCRQWLDSGNNIAGLLFYWSFKIG